MRLGLEAPRKKTPSQIQIISRRVCMYHLNHVVPSSILIFCHRSWTMVDIDYQLPARAVTCLQLSVVAVVLGLKLLASMCWQLVV